jgi:hypothetical protein
MGGEGWSDKGANLDRGTFLFFVPAAMLSKSGMAGYH